MSADDKSDPGPSPEPPPPAGAQGQRTVFDNLPAGARTATFPPPEKSEQGGAAPAAGPPGVPVVAGYLPVRKLGEGTYGQVWLYEEARTGIQVAVKFFARGWGIEWLLLQAEVKQLALLHADPGIVQLEDVEADASPPYYVMNYAPGGSLAQRLEGGQRLPLREALRIFREVTTALAYVHAKGIRHCDLKPGNILLDARGRALIADFGQAHLASDASPALGTFYYMAPEQADLDRPIPDTRWDVYGLGALFYAMLTGAPPRERADLWEAEGAPLSLPARLQRYREAVRAAPAPTNHRKVSGMDGALASILERCLELAPERRFHDAGAVLEALARRERAIRRRPLLLFGLVAPLFLLLVMTALAYWNGRREIDLAGEHLARQLQESDRVSARLVANVVEDTLHDRTEHLRAFRQEHRKELLQVKGGRPASPPLRSLLEQLHRQGAPHKFFRQYSIADHKGWILAGYPNHTEQVADRQGRPRCWAFRDWFSGRGDRHGHEEEWFEPIRATHVSQPYVSRMPGQAYLSVNVSVPLFNEGRPERVIGVLTGQIVVRDLHAWLEGVIPDGFVVLLNERGHCLHHQERSRIEPPPNENPIDWREPCELYRRALSDDPGDGLARYTDPILGKELLAGYAPFPPRESGESVRWLALVQHERATALRPVADLKVNLLVNCALALTLGALLTTSLWGWMVWTLHREERAAEG